MATETRTWPNETRVPANLFFIAFPRYVETDATWNDTFRGPYRELSLDAHPRNDSPLLFSHRRKLTNA